MARHVRLEIQAIHALHRDEDLPVVLIDVVNGADVSVTERRNRVGLPAEPPHRVGIISQLIWKKFERNFAPQPRILGFIDDAHTAGAELAGDLIMANPAAEHLWGCWQNTRLRDGACTLCWPWCRQCAQNSRV